MAQTEQQPAQLSIRIPLDTRISVTLSAIGRLAFGNLKAAKFSQPVELLDLLEAVAQCRVEQVIDLFDKPPVIILPESAEIREYGPTFTVPFIRQWMESEKKKGGN